MAAYCENEAKVSGDEMSEDEDDDDVPTKEDHAFIDDTDIMDENSVHATDSQLQNESMHDADDLEEMEAVMQSLRASGQTCIRCQNPKSKRAHATWCRNRKRDTNRKRKQIGNTGKLGVASKKKSKTQPEQIGEESEVDEMEEDKENIDDKNEKGPQQILRTLFPST